MKSSQSYLDEINRLRRRHKLNFETGRWTQNETVRRKIKNAFDAYHRAVEREAQNIKPNEYNFFVLDAGGKWVARSRTIRGAYAIHKRLAKHGGFTVCEIAPHDPARHTKKNKGQQ